MHTLDTAFLICLAAVLLVLTIGWLSAIRKRKAIAAAKDIQLVVRQPKWLLILGSGCILFAGAATAAALYLVKAPVKNPLKPDYAGWLVTLFPMVLLIGFITVCFLLGGIASIALYHHKIILAVPGGLVYYYPLKQVQNIPYSQITHMQMEAQVHGHLILVVYAGDDPLFYIDKTGKDWRRLKSKLTQNGIPEKEVLPRSMR